MKGIVFTEFFDMVRAKHSEDLADELMDTVESPSQGAYTAVGTYDFRELVAYVTRYCELTNTSGAEALDAFGYYLFWRFKEGFGHFFAKVEDAFSFLGQIEDVIHVEVLKLYPDAELPRFEIEHSGDHMLIMRYRSVRRMQDLAHGLIRATVENYGEAIDIERQPTEDGGELFTLTRRV